MAVSVRARKHHRAQLSLVPRWQGRHGQDHEIGDGKRSQGYPEYPMILETGSFAGAGAVIADDKRREFATSIVTRQNRTNRPRRWSALMQSGSERRM